MNGWWFRGIYNEGLMEDDLYISAHMIPAIRSFSKQVCVTFANDRRSTNTAFTLQSVLHSMDIINQ